MIADSDELKALLSDPKLRELPPALSDILDRAPEKGILPWLAEIDRVVCETVRESDRLGDNLQSAMRFYLLDPGEERQDRDLSRNDLLCLAGMSQAALSFYSKGEMFAVQKAQSLCCLAMSLVSLGSLTRNDAEARSLLSRAIELGEEILGAREEDKRPTECLRANEIIGAGARQLYIRRAGEADPMDYLEREVEAWEEAIRISAKANPSRRSVHLELALASAAKEFSPWLDDPIAREMLDRASRFLDEALKNLDRGADPEHWVKIQMNLGYLRSKQAELESEDESYHSHRASGNAYREALLGMNKEDDPVLWARTNHGFADALRMQAIRSTNDSEAVPLLERSIDAYENAVQVLTGEKFTEEFVRIGNEYGDALLELGRLNEGTKSRRYLERSVEVMEKAKDYIDSRTDRFELIELQERLDFALQHLSQHFPEE